LPVAARMLSVAPRRRVRLLRPVGVLGGALTLIATSPPLEYLHQPFVVNRNKVPATVTVTHVLVAPDCASPLATVAASLNNGSLADPIPLVLESGEVAALDRQPNPQETPRGKCGLAERNVYRGWDDPICTIVLLASNGAPDLLVRAKAFWYETETG